MTTPSVTEAARADLLAAYAAALQAVAGRERVRDVLLEECAVPPWSEGRLAVIAVGKAAAHMMAGAFDTLGSRIGRALLITKHGYVERLWPDEAPVTCIESAHPRPDRTSLAAGAELIAFLDREADGESGVVFLVSGGASSLVESLHGGLDEEVLGKVGRWLLASGLNITALNRIRKRLSRIKGGRLAARLHGRPALQLMISDVPEDDPRVIGSGLMVAHDERDIDVSELSLPDWLSELLASAEPLAPSAAFERVRTRVVARPADARRAAVECLQARGRGVRVHDELVEGEAVPVGRQLIGQVLGQPGVAQVWSGEVTVTLPAVPGRGGRCQAMALAAACEIEGRDDTWFLAAGTDGTDGPVDDAGAMVDGGTVQRGRDAGLEPAVALAAADAGTFLEASGDLLNTGPTGTNVMDVMLGLSLPADSGQR